MNKSHFGRPLLIPSTLQSVHDLLVFSAARKNRNRDVIVHVLSSNASPDIRPVLLP